MRNKVFAICGSTRAQSASRSILQFIMGISAERFKMEIYEDLSLLPHFNPDLDKDPAPPLIEALRNKIKTSDGVLICTPEYVYSLPGALKNVIEWCVSTTVFSEKPVGLITAAASGVKAHESLQLVMKTIYADLRPGTQLLIQGAKGKVNEQGQIVDENLVVQLQNLADAFAAQMDFSL